MADLMVSSIRRGHSDLSLRADIYGHDPADPTSQPMLQVSTLLIASRTLMFWSFFRHFGQRAQWNTPSLRRKVTVSSRPPGCKAGYTHTTSFRVHTAL